MTDGEYVGIFIGVVIALLIANRLFGGDDGDEE